MTATSLSSNKTNDIGKGGDSFESKQNIESNKEFVHVSNNDIMHCEMQAFSLPEHFDSKSTFAKDGRLEQNIKNTTEAGGESLKSDLILVEEELMESEEIVIQKADTQEIIVTHDMHMKVIHGNAQIVDTPHEKQTEEEDEVCNDNDKIMSALQVQSESLHHHVHKHRAKAVMTILSTRIIDINSLRDIHVGLPHGKYGFVFCGRSHFSNSDFDGTDYDDHNDGRDDICHPLSILSSDHDYFDTSRDYLCAVNTLEEAQNWVAALRWAANLAKAKTSRNQCDPYFDENSLSDEASIGRTLSANSIGSSYSPSRRKNYLNGLRHNSITLSIEDERSVSSGEHVSSASISNGIAIVSKVSTIQLELSNHKRLFGFVFDIKYEVKMLLLCNIRLSNRSRKRKASDFGNGKNWSVQERTIYCTKKQLLDLIQKLHHDFSKEEENNADVEKVIKDARDSLIHDISSLSKLPQSISVHSQLRKSIENVDTILRTLATDTSLCNTAVVKDFLLKEKKNSYTKVTPTVLHKQFSCFLDDKFKTRKRVLDIVVGDSTDEFVKKWLFGSKEEIKIANATFIKLMLQSPIVEACATIMVLSFVWYLYFIWTQLLFHIKTVRVDLCIVYTIFVFGFGFKAGNIYMKQVLRDSSQTHVASTYTQDKEVYSQRKSKSKNNRSYEQVSAKLESSDSTSSEEDLNSFRGEEEKTLSSPLPYYSGEKCQSSSWSQPQDNIFKVRGKTYLVDRVKIPSDPSPFKCRGIDMWLTNNPERNISRHPSMLGGKLSEEDTFIVNFLLPFGNFVTYFSVPPLSEIPKNVATVWTKFIQGNQQDRDARLKLLPVVVEGPWIVKKAVGHGPALLGQSIPLQYFFTPPTDKKKGIYEVDVIITASRIAKGILNVVKGNTKRLTLGIAFIIEAAKESELPETVLCSCQLHSLHLELCPSLPQYFLEDVAADSED